MMKEPRINEPAVNAVLPTFPLAGVPWLGMALAPWISAMTPGSAGSALGATSSVRPPAASATGARPAASGARATHADALPALDMAPSVLALSQGGMEMQSLISRRAQAYVGLSGKLAECRSPLDVMAVQMEFWQTAAEAYVQSAQKIGTVWSHGLPSGALVEPLNPWVALWSGFAIPATRPNQRLSPAQQSAGPQRDRMAVTHTGTDVPAGPSPSLAPVVDPAKPDATGDGRRAA